MADKATFGRKWLAEIIRSEDLSPEEKEEKIMAGHIGVTDGLKDRIDELKKKADTADDLQKQLDEKGSGEDWEKKYHDEHKAFEDFKQQITQNAELEEIKKAHSNLLQEAGISADRIGAIQRITDFSGMKRDKDGKLENEAEIREAISKEWAAFIPKDEKRPAKVDNPPKQDNKTFETMSLAEKMAYANQNPNDPQVTAWMNK